MRRQHNAKPRPLVLGCERMSFAETRLGIYLFAPVISTVKVFFSSRSCDGTSMLEDVVRTTGCRTTMRKGE